MTNPAFPHPEAALVPSGAPPLRAKGRAKFSLRENPA